MNHTIRTSNSSVRSRRGRATSVRVTLLLLMLSASVALSGCATLSGVSRVPPIKWLIKAPAAPGVAEARAQAKAEKRAQAAARSLASKQAKSAKSAKSPKPPKHDSDSERPMASIKPSEFEKRTAEAREQALLAPQEPYWPYRLGQLLAGADSNSAAEGALEKSLARSPRYAPALSLLSKLWYDSGRHAEAVALLEPAVAETTAWPDGVPAALWAGLALHYDALDRIDDARAIMASLTRTASRDARAALVYLTLRSNQPEGARSLASDAVADEGKSAVNQNNFGITQLRGGDPVAARRAFLRAIEIDPRQAGPYYNLAILEKFYLFDEEAAGRWSHAYRERAKADPDSLFAAFERSEFKRLAQQGN